jgi:hypothetical protein
MFIALLHPGMFIPGMHGWPCGGLTCCASATAGKTKIASDNLRNNFMGISRNRFYRLFNEKARTSHFAPRV